MKELHYLFSSDPFIECLLKGVSSEATDNKVRESVVFAHKQFQDRNVQLIIRVRIHFEIRLDNDKSIFGGLHEIRCRTDQK
jgi:hypothetical protein